LYKSGLVGTLAVQKRGEKMRIPDVTYPMGEPEIHTPRTPEIVTPHDPETGPKESPHSVPDRTTPRRFD
jgi:hypothetical protein